ncbi:MAG: outer membrane protein assembly factor BamE [Pseudomonadota bacterium]
MAASGIGERMTAEGGRRGSGVRQGDLRSGIRGATRLLLAAVLGVGLAACSATYRGHGYAPNFEELENVQPGQDTKGSVRAKIGRPGGTGIVSDDAWYYVASTVEHYAYRAPAVVDRRVVAIRFDAEGIVADVALFGIEEGQVIDLVTRTTPTYGRELTVVQQLMGNLLNFNAGSLLQ